MRSVERFRLAKRRDAARGLTDSKRRRLADLAREFTRARAAYVEYYWSDEYCGKVLRDPRRLIDERLGIGWASAALGPHQNRIAMKSALVLVKVGWVRTLKHVRTLIYANPRLSSVERRWLAYVMRWPYLLQRALDRQEVHVPESWSHGLDEVRLAYRLRRMVRRYREPRPKIASRTWLWLDTNLYRPVDRSVASRGHSADEHFGGAWLAVSGLAPRKRILVPLAGRGLDEFAPRTGLRNSRPMLRGRVAGRTVVFWSPVIQELPAQRSGIAAGVDKGLKTLVTLSTGDPTTAQGFGVGADTLVGAVAEQAVQRIKQRRRLMAHERSIRNSQPERARHIRRRNLTDTASRATSDRERGRLREQIGCALNTLFRVRPDVAALYVEELNFASRRMSKQVHRRLNRWLKGYMQRQLITKAKLNGVELNVVNAAYTSQTCPSCWYTSSRNRSADRFECSQCGFNGSADAVAATNVLRRGSDLAITRFTPATRVKQILDERWHSARLGRAWGSNEGDSAERWTGVGASDRHEPRTTVKLALRESDGPFTRMFSSCGDGLRAGVSADPGGVDIRHC